MTLLLSTGTFVIGVVVGFFLLAYVKRAELAKLRALSAKTTEAERMYRMAYEQQEDERLRRKWAANGGGSRIINPFQ